MLSVMEFKSQEITIALFLCHSVNNGDDESRQGQVPLINATLCFVDKTIITDLLQLSKFSPLKMLETRGCSGLSDGWIKRGSIDSI